MKLKLNNMKNILAGGLLLFTGFNFCFNIISFASPKNIDSPNMSIARNFGGSLTDNFYSVEETQDGGFVAVGYSMSSDAGFENKGGIDAVIMKLDSEGNQQWVKSVGGSNNDYFKSVIETSDKGFLCIGHSESTNAGFSNRGRSDGIIVKFDSGGNQQWIENFGGSSWDGFYSAVETSDKGFVAIGESASKDAGFDNKKERDNGIIVKFNSQGSQQWVKAIGGDNNSYFKSIGITSDEGFIVVGESTSTNIGFNNKGGYDAIIVKFDSGGSQQWIKNFGGYSYEVFHSVIETSDKGFIAIGDSSSTDAGFNNPGRDDGVIVKYNSNGEQQWVSSFNGSADTYFRSVIETSDEGLAVVGYSWSTDSMLENKGYCDAILVKYDNEGRKQWAKSFGGSGYDYFMSLVETSSEGFMVVGYSNSIDLEFENKGGYDSIIVKYDNKEFEIAEDMVLKAEGEKKREDISCARDLVNKLPESMIKDQLQSRLDAIFPNITLNKQTSSVNSDIYIVMKNRLSMSIDTSYVVFEDFDSTEDMEKLEAINISIDSSIPYSLNAYMPTGIQSVDGTDTMHISTLNIKESSEQDYNVFKNMSDKVILKDMCRAGVNNKHAIDLKLSNARVPKNNIYKTVIKFEAEQK